MVLLITNYPGVTALPPLFGGDDVPWLNLEPSTAKTSHAPPQATPKRNRNGYASTVSYGIDKPAIGPTNSSTPAVSSLGHLSSRLLGLVQYISNQATRATAQHPRTKASSWRS